jgi:hypothetical protein
MKLQTFTYLLDRLSDRGVHGNEHLVDTPVQFGIVVAAEGKDHGRYGGLLALAHEVEVKLKGGNINRVRIRCDKFAVEVSLDWSRHERSARIITIPCTAAVCNPYTIALLVGVMSCTADLLVGAAAATPPTATPSLATGTGLVEPFPARLFVLEFVVMAFIIERFSIAASNSG